MASSVLAALHADGTARRDSLTRSDFLRKHSIRTSHSFTPEGQILWLESIDQPSEVLCCKFSADGRYFATGLADGLIQVYYGEKLKRHCELDERIEGTTPIPCTSLHFMNLHSQHCLLSTYADGVTRIWNLTTHRCMQKSSEQKQALCSSIDAVTSKYVVGGDNPQITLYDIKTSTPISTMTASEDRDVMNGHRSRILAVQYHPREKNLIVSGGWDDTVQFWDDRQAHAVRKIYGPHICGDSLDIDPSNNHLLTGSWRKDDVLQVWDMLSGLKLKDIPHDSLQHSMLYCCQWFGKDDIICGGNEHNMMRIVDKGTLNTVAQVAGFESGVFCLDHDRSHANGHAKIILGSGKSVHVFKRDKK